MQGVKAGMEDQHSKSQMATRRALNVQNVSPLGRNKSKCQCLNNQDGPFLFVSPRLEPSHLSAAPSRLLKIPRPCVGIPNSQRRGQDLPVSWSKA